MRLFSQYVYSHIDADDTLITSHVGVCRFCGNEGYGMSFASWLRDTFVDYAYLLEGSIVCAACQFCLHEQSVILARRVGKDKPQRFRTYSHIITRRNEWFVLSKAQKRTLASLLIEQPRFAIIAFSGQKHLFFRIRDGYWQFEEQYVKADSTLLSHILHWTTEMYVAGVTKTSIQTHMLSAREIQKCGTSLYRDFVKATQRYKDSAMYHLAVFITTHGDEQSYDE